MDTDVVKLYVTGVILGCSNQKFSVMYFIASVGLYFISTAFCLRIESKYEVTVLGGLNELMVKFNGPPESNLCFLF